MEKAGVPVVPGYHGDNQDPAFLKSEAEKIGYPVLIKAIKGGGGKGMRIVESPEDFDEMLNSSKRESMKSFGDDRVLVEKYLVTPRHVEVQVFCDKLGNAVYLFERDCSVQRRHQKIIEEAPAPHLSDETRRLLGEKAVAAAKAVNYVGAGTVEFIMDNTDGKFFFMEMNTRLQVEHPVTEMVTRTDLVEWQLEVASGNRLPRLQDELSLQGHSFEARIYAENPRNNFLPDTGKLSFLQTPVPSPTVRVETGVRQGDEVSVYYDPMIAKLVVWGKDRDTALLKLRKCLAEYQKHETALFPPLTLPDPSLVMQASLAILAKEQNETRYRALRSSDPNSPWSQCTSMRLNHQPLRVLQFYTDEDGKSSNPTELRVTCESKKDMGGYNVVVDVKGETHVFSDLKACVSDDSVVVIQSSDQTYQSRAVVDGEYVHLFPVVGETLTLRLGKGGLVALGGDEASTTASAIKSPMPCKIAQVLCKSGQNVKKGTPLIILEAMKMEHVMRAPMDGTIDRVSFTVGQLVAENKVLVTFRDADK